MKTKHTPGPWEVGVSDATSRVAHLARVAERMMRGEGETFPLVWAPEHPGTRLGHDPSHPEHAVIICDMGNGPAGEANATLVAAAPDLLDACETLHFELVVGSDPKTRADVLAGAVTAMRKARGGK